MNNLLKHSKLFFKRNSSTILTCAGAVGVVATSVAVAKATPRAIELLEAAEKEKEDDLSKLEIVKTATPVYLTSILLGVSTIACIFGANALNKRQQAALMSAYALVQNSYKQYQEKVKELYGEETHQAVVDSIAVEKAKDQGVYADCMLTSCDLSVDNNTSKPVMFYDHFSDRYFEATIEQVLTAEYHFNRNFVLRGYTVLNELYDFIGIEPTKPGSVLGWCVEDEFYWIDFNHRKTVTDEGEEIYILEMPYEPSTSWEENYYG